MDAPTKHTEEASALMGQRKLLKDAAMKDATILLLMEMSALVTE